MASASPQHSASSLPLGLGLGFQIVVSARMGRRQKPKAKIDHQEDEEGANSSRSVIYLSSSDDEEANEDLSLKIVEKAMKRASKTDHNDAVLAGRSAVIDLGSSPSEAAEVITDRSGPTTDDDAEVKSKKKKSRKEKRANKNIENQEKTVSIFILSVCFLDPAKAFSFFELFAG